MALIPICAGLCSSAEGLCESCQHCKTASLEGERQDVHTSSRGLCTTAASKALGMFLLSLNSSCAPTSGSRTAKESCKPRACSPCMPAAQSKDICTKILGNQTCLPSSLHNVASLHVTTAKASWPEMKTQCWRENPEQKRQGEEFRTSSAASGWAWTEGMAVSDTASVVGFRAPDQEHPSLPPQLSHAFRIRKHAFLAASFPLEHYPCLPFQTAGPQQHHIWPCQRGDSTQDKEMRMQPPAQPQPSLTGYPEHTWHERLPPCCCRRCVTTSAASPCARTVPAHVQIGQIWGAGFGAQVQRCLKAHKTLHSQKREAGTERRPTSHLCLSPASHESELCSGDPSRTPTRHHQTHDTNPISSQSLMKCLSPSIPMMLVSLCLG